MGMRDHALLFFGVHVHDVDLTRLKGLPEFANVEMDDIKDAIDYEDPLPGQKVYISCLGEGSGWAISAGIPVEVGPINNPLDAFAGDRALLLRIAKQINTHTHEPSYVGWQVQQGCY